ncbi:MAG: hypothetical protein FJ245_09850 [Nitrospira sp.]|nr:hypothetical protein [Nitrospira sp.]
MLTEVRGDVTAGKLNIPYGRIVPVFLLAYILSLGFAWSPFPFNMQWSDIIFLGLLGGFVARGGLRHVQFTGPDYAVFAYVAGSLNSLIWANRDGDSAIHVVKLVYLASMYIVVRTLCMDEDLRRLAAWGIAGGAALLSLLGAMYLLAYSLFGISDGALGVPRSVPYLGPVLRLELNFYTPELLGCYLTVGVAFMLALRTAPFAGRRATWLTLAFLLILTTETLTFSHSLVGFAVAALIAFHPRNMGTWWVWVRRGLAVSIVLLFIGMLFVSTFYVHEFSVESRTVPRPIGPVDSHVLQSETWPHLTINATYSYLHYHVLKVLAWETFVEHPLGGLGLGTFPSVSEQAYQGSRLSRSCRGCEPHNTVLGQLAETGLVGGIPLLVLWGWLFADGWKILRSSQGTDSEWIARACLGGLVGLFVNGLYTDVMHFRFLWVDMAVLNGLILSTRWAHVRTQQGNGQTAYLGAEAPTTV